MSRCYKQPFGWVFISRMIGIICFLMVMVLANILGHYVTNPVFLSGVTFLNINFWLLLLICIIVLIGDLFCALPFPLSLPGPIIKAIGSVIGIAFIIKVFQWIDSVAGTMIYPGFLPLSFLIIPLVFVIVLACGYYEILRKLWWTPAPVPEKDTLVVHEASSEALSGPESLPPGPKSWDEIGNEFRLMLFEIIHRLREDLRRR